METKPTVRRKRNCGYRYMMPSYVDVDDPDIEGISYLVIADALLENSSAHGLPTVYRARGGFKKLFWIVVMMGMAGVLIYNIVQLTTKYINYPVSVKLKVDHQQQLTFPAVTICNMSPVKKSSFEAAQNINSRKKRSINNFCLPSWDYYNGSCYYTSDAADKVNHSTAHAKCQAMGADLASINDQQEMNFVLSISPGTDYWFGLIKTNATVTAPTYWLDGNPSTYRWWGGNDEPVECIRYRQNGFYDRPCSFLFQYTCKMPSDGNDSTTTVTEFVSTTERVTTTVLTTTTQQTEKDTTTTPVETTTTPLVTSQETTTAAVTSIQCCCRCCFNLTSSPVTSSCTVCGDSSLAEASQCAAQPPPAPTPFIRPTEPNFDPPAQLEGSQFAERLAVTPEFAAMEQLTESLAALPVSEQSALGFTAADFILECTYDGFPCNMGTDFTQFFNPIHGNCYVFNSGWNATAELKTSTRSGRRHGLTMTVNVQQYEYVTEAGDTAGVVVVILPQYQMPFPEDDGIMVSPGLATSIGIVQRNVKREPAPYGDCKDPASFSAADNAYSDFYPVQYTASACEKTCYQRNVIEQCQCSDAYFPSSNASAFNHVIVPVCSTSNITQDDCKYSVSMQFQNGKLECKCPDRCSDTLYQTETSLFSWPSKVTKTQLKSNMKSKLGSNFQPNDDNIYNNLLKMDIFYKEFNFENIEEKPSYLLLQYISDSGGVLGLWFGFAIMTFIEFFEFFVDLVVLTATKLSRCCCH